MVDNAFQLRLPPLTKERLEQFPVQFTIDYTQFLLHDLDLLTFEQRQNYIGYTFSPALDMGLSPIVKANDPGENLHGWRLTGVDATTFPGVESMEVYHGTTLAIVLWIWNNRKRTSEQIDFMNAMIGIGFNVFANYSNSLFFYILFMMHSFINLSLIHI